MNNLVVLRSRPLEALTQFSLCLPGYLFENDSRVVPEKFEGEPAVPIIPLHSHTISFAHHNPLGEVLVGRYRGETLAIQSPTPISIPNYLLKATSGILV